MLARAGRLNLEPSRRISVARAPINLNLLDRRDRAWQSAAPGVTE
jgi:hypothetical protein